jgi:putative oxidoreductase
MSQDLGRLILRLSIGGMMFLHGFHKMRNGIGGITSNVVEHGLPPAVAYGVYVGELLAPMFVMLGLFTRPAALTIAFNMVVAIWLSMPHQVFALGKGGAWGVELPALFLFGALAIALLGTGRYAVMNGTGRWS